MRPTRWWSGTGAVDVAAITLRRVPLSFYADRGAADLPGVAQQAVPADPERIQCDAHVDEQRPALDVRAGQEAPEPAIPGIVAIVPHDPVAVGRHDQRTPRVRRRLVMLGVRARVVGQLSGAHLGDLE